MGNNTDDHPDNKNSHDVDLQELGRRRHTASFHKGRVRTDFGNSVRWDRIRPADVEAFQALLDQSVCRTNRGDRETERCICETKVHGFLEENPQFLIQLLGGGHGRWQVTEHRDYFRSKPRLGSEYVPDFLIAESSSIGMEWRCVEIKAPCKKVQLQKGHEAQGVRDAIHQIRDWRKWLMENLRTARDPKTESGLGLAQIDARLPGLILIGRTQEFHWRFNEFRRQMKKNEGISIHTYDWLLQKTSTNLSGGWEA